MSTPEYAVYRAVVNTANTSTGAVTVRIPELLGAEATVSVPTQGLTKVNNVWNVPTPDSHVYLAVSKDRTQFRWLTAISATTSQGTAYDDLSIADTLTVGGDLTVDTDTLHVDSTNNRVGIGTTLPENALHVLQSGFSPSANDDASIQVEGNFGGGVVFAEGNNRTMVYAPGGNEFRVRVGASDSGGGTEALSIDSVGKVGIGTSGLTVSGGISATGAVEVDGYSVANPVGSVIQYAGSSAPDASWLICDGSAISRTTYAALFAVLGTTYGAGNGSTTFNIPNLKGRVAVGLDSGQTEFDALGETGGAKTHTLATGEMPSHTHTQNAHSHTQNAHTHTQNAHTHTQNSHYHIVGLDDATPADLNDVNLVQEQTGSTYAGWSIDIVNTVSGQRRVIASKTTATNQNATATNNNTTATNQNATATNQNTGGGGAHNNLQPYIAMNYIIKAR